MVRHKVMGKGGMTLAVIAAVAMAAFAIVAGPQAAAGGNMGICLPSPDLWGLSALASGAVNLGLMLVTAIMLYALNREFNFVQGSDSVLTGMFLVMAASNVWVSGRLSSSIIVALANLICLLVLFGCYRKRNAMQELFLIATILSLGSMIQYAFIFMMPVYMLGAAMLKCFSFRGFIAFLMGVAAPYWVGVGLGIIPVEDFSMPVFTDLSDANTSKQSVFFGLLSIGITTLVGFILALNNSVRLYAGNTQRRLYNMVINLLGLVAALCTIIDFNNILAYMATVYMITAVQLGNLFALWNVHRAWLWLLMLSAIYVGCFFMMIRL